MEWCWDGDRVGRVDADEGAPLIPLVTPVAAGEVVVDVRDKGDRWDRPTEQR